MRLIIKIYMIILMITFCDPFPISRESFCDSRGQDGCSCVNLNDHESSCCCAGLTVDEVPRNFSKNITRLLLKGVGLTRITDLDFQFYSALTHIEIIQAPNLAFIDSDAFKYLPRLKKLSITDCPNLKRIDGYLLQNNIDLLAFDFSENEIETIDTGDAESIVVSGLRLSHNRIKSIGDYAFKKSEISVLRLDNNPITEISSKAFAGISALKKLDLSWTNLKSLPDEGLHRIEELIIQHTPTLKSLPPLIAFTHLKVAKLTYPYHCCLFKYATPKDSLFQAKKYEGNLQELREKYCSTTRAATTSTVSQLSTVKSNAIVVKKLKNNTETKGTSKQVKIPFGSFGKYHASSEEKSGKTIKKRHTQNSPTNKWDFMGQFGVFYDDEEYAIDAQDDQAPDAKINKVQLSSMQSIQNDQSRAIMPKSRLPPALTSHHDMKWELEPFTVPPTVVQCVDAETVVHDFYVNVECSPQPNALNPCEDVMIGWHLRILIFFVWIAAILGNVLVIVVLCITNQPRQRVNNFLMINLAFADLCTGVYLAMLAVEDVMTKGEYYNYAVAWQTGWGCRIAGTLTVFASELSIVIMVLISFEVWYNTKYAIFQKRLTLSVIFRIVLAGWIFACAMAALPLFGINDYSATSTCLPLRMDFLKDRIYLIICLCANVFGFAYIVFNYVSVYCMVAGSMAATAHAQDMALAKLMFCLIFTDFLCWAPTVFFGLTAAANVPLISISVAKIFLVLFYPLNAFANPWLYVFLTKRFRKNASRFMRKHVWLREFISNTLRQHNSHPEVGSNNYFYQSQPHHPTHETNLTSQRSSPSTCSSALVTPRGSKSTPVDSNSRSDSTGSCNEIVAANELSALLVQSMAAQNSSNALAVTARRKSTTQKFRPQMSDIIENSHSNSAEDEQHQKHLHSPIRDVKVNLLREYLPAPISALIGRKRGSPRGSDDGQIELMYYHTPKNEANFPLYFPRHKADSVSEFSMESGYCTTSPLLLTPESTNGRHLISDSNGNARRHRSSVS